MAASRSATLAKGPRRTALAVSSPNQRSTKLSQLELVGTKCGTKRGWRLSHAFTLGACECRSCPSPMEAKTPYEGKKLLGHLAGSYSYRLTYQDRIVYSIDDVTRTVYIERARTHDGE